MLKRGVTRRKVLRYAAAGGLVGAGVAGALPWALGAEVVATEAEPLDPLTVEKYRNQLSMPRVLAPTLVRDSAGRVVRHDYAMSQNVIRAQILPPPCRRRRCGRSAAGAGFRARPRPSSWPQHRGLFSRTPGAGIPARVTWRDQIDRPHILPVDPKIMWANPNGFEAPEEPLNNVNYRVRVAHTSRSSEPPTARFDLWERVNNNDGSWQPQIIYAIQDRVMYNGQLYQARHVHQARSSQTPASRPDLWEPLPMTAKGQLVKFADPNDPVQAPFYEIGLNGTEEEARAVLGGALATIEPVHAMPSAGITEDATEFEVPDGTSFRPAPRLGTVYYETMSRLVTITVGSLGFGQSVTVNGRPLRSNSNNYPLPPMRNEGYLIRVTNGATFTAR